MPRLKQVIQHEITRQITDHLVKHVLRPGDTRDRIDILTDELSTSILNIVKRKIIYGNRKRNKS